MNGTLLEVDINFKSVVMVHRFYSACECGGVCGCACVLACVRACVRECVRVLSCNSVRVRMFGRVRMRVKYYAYRDRAQHWPYQV